MKIKIPAIATGNDLDASKPILEFKEDGVDYLWWVEMYKKPWSHNLRAYFETPKTTKRQGTPRQ